MSAVGGDSAVKTYGTNRELFSKVFTTYLEMGMSYDEFYNKDHTLAKDYREVFKRKRDKENFDMWLQGLYVYHAIAKISPILIPFAKNPKPEPYFDKPLPLYDTAESEEQSKAVAKANAVADKGMAYMLAKMSAINKKFGEG